MNLIKKIFLHKNENVNKPKELNFEDELILQFGNIGEKIINHINILIITDTHNCLYYDQASMEIIKNAKYDICLILGDVSNNDIFEILKYVPYDKIWGILGNHDGLDRFDESNIRNLSGKVINVNGVEIAAIQGSHRYKSGDYGMYTHEESIEIADAMPKADILVSHDKPFLIDNNDNVHDGLKGITYYCYKNHVKYQIHGHLHEESEEVLKNGTIVYGRYKVCLLQL